MDCATHNPPPSQTIVVSLHPNPQTDPIIKPATIARTIPITIYKRQTEQQDMPP
jgi:hypothetical protein